MRKPAALTAIVVLLVFSLAAQATPATGPRISLYLQVLVPVDASGQPGPPILADALPDEPAALIHEAIAGLRFAPATRGGEPVASELSLSVHVNATRVGETVEYELGKVTATPIARQMPRYPIGPIREGIAGAVMLRVELAPEAGPDRMKAEVVGSEVAGRRAGRFRADFEKAALDSLASCCALVETIDGQPLSQVVYLPVSFSANWSKARIDMDAFREKWTGETSDLPDGLTRAELLASATSGP